MKRFATSRTRFLLFLLSACLMAAGAPAHAAEEKSAPPDVPKPTIPDKTFDVTKFGAVGDGKTMNTAAITKAIEACTKAGGGTVLLPAGRYLTGPLALASSMNLRIDEGATLLLSDNPSDFRLNGNRRENCIAADDCHDLAITGKGTIDGQGERWWDEFRKAKSDSASSEHRPFMVVLNKCTRVLIQDVTLTNSPMFHLVPKACQDVTIDGVHFQAPARAPNTDGLDPSGYNYLITRCVFDVGDDCIAVKATGKPPEGKASCENFLITDCQFLHGHGMSIGGQTPGGLRKLTVRDCTFRDTDAGIRMKAPRGQGGLVEDLTYENLKMENVKVAILITSYYPKIPEKPAEEAAQAVNATTPIWRHIRINNVTSENGTTAGEIIGLPEMPVEDVVMTNVHLSAKKGMRIDNAKGIRFENSDITAESGPKLTLDKAEATGLDSKSAK